MIKLLIIVIILSYKKYISPFLVKLFGGACRYEPTCSVYAKEALDKYGIIKGGVMAIKRFLSCNPFSSKEHYDPVK